MLKLFSSVKLGLSRQLTASCAAIRAGFAAASSISAYVGKKARSLPLEMTKNENLRQLREYSNLEEREATVFLPQIRP